MQIAIETDKEASSQGVVVEGMRVDTRKEAKLFHMLSNTLYSNKPAAIIRELCSNAYDSHIMADKPGAAIKIIAPTLESPELVIQDQGIGLTASEAKDTILCYLGSNKDTSDEFIGGWGIGSKSPFAYSKNYTVVCVKAGVRAEFMCWKDEHGLPKSALVSEDPTSDPDGVEMRVPVESRDVTKFNTTLREYLDWTNYNVVVKVADRETSVRKTEQRISLELFDIEIRKSKDQYKGEVRLVYGGYSYEMSDCIESGDDLHDEFQKLMRYSNAGYDVLVVAKIPGTVTFNMNREELEQTDKTKAFIRQAVMYLVGVVDSRKARGLKELEETDDRDELTLKRLQDTITSMLSTGSEEEAIVSQAFQIFEATVRYRWKGKMWAMSRYNTTPNEVHQTQFKISNLDHQFVIFYSRNKRPQRRYIENAMSSIPDIRNLHRLFVVGETEGDARKYISELEDFKDFDFSGVKFIKIENPKPQPSSTPRASGVKMPPRPYCSISKKFIKWNASDVYLMHNDPKSVEESDEYIRALKVYEMSGSKWRKVYVFSPTPEFVKKNSGLDNVFKYEDWVKKQQEVETENNKLYALPVDKRRIRGAILNLRELVDGNLPSKYRENVRGVSRDYLSWFHQAEEWDGKETARLEGRGLEIAMACEKLIGEVKKIKTRLQFIDIDRLEHALTSSRVEKKIRDEAKALISSLKLNTYFEGA